MKYQHVADVDMEFYSCATCVKGVLGGVEQHYNPWQYLGDVCRKIALLKSLIFATSKEPKSHSFWAIGQILVSKEAEFFDLQGYRFFFIFPILKKIRRLESQFFRQKCIFLKNNVKLEN